MKFTTPPAYHLLIGIIFPEETDNHRQAEQTPIILNELEKMLEDKFNIEDCLKKPAKKSLSVNYFLPKENSRQGAKKEFKQGLKNLRIELKKLSKKYGVGFHIYIYNQLQEFFTD